MKHAPTASVTDLRNLLVRPSQRPVWRALSTCAVVLGVAAAVSGCTDRLPQLRAQAASDFKCKKPVQIEMEIGNDSIRQVFACGNQMVYMWHDHKEKWVSPLERAVFDLSCQGKELRTRILDSGGVAFAGCGQKAVYMWTWGSGWVANSSSKAQ